MSVLLAVTGLGRNFLLLEVATALYAAGSSTLNALWERWVNQVELFFSILQRKVIRNGNFTSRQDLINKLLTFITDYDQTARPFRWTYAADPLVA